MLQRKTDPPGHPEFAVVGMDRRAGTDYQVPAAGKR
jgi:hypothetical protein